MGVSGTGCAPLSAIHGAVRPGVEMSRAILHPESYAGDTHRSMFAGGASFELVGLPCHSIANVAASELWSVAVHMCE